MCWEFTWIYLSVARLAGCLGYGRQTLREQAGRQVHRMCMEVSDSLRDNEESHKVIHSPVDCLDSDPHGG